MANLPYANNNSDNWWADMFTNDTMTQYLDGGGADNQRSYEGAKVSPSEAIGYAKTFSSLAGATSIPGVSYGFDVARDVADGKTVGQAVSRSTVKQGVNALGMLGLPGQVAQSVIGVTMSENPAKTATRAVGTALGSLFGPLGSLVGGMLGTAAYDSYNDGMIGDGLDSRSHEGARDRAENAGYSRGQTADGAGVDADRDAFGGSGYSGIGPGIGTSGYSLDPSVTDMDPYGGYNLGSDAAASFGGGGNDSSDSSSSGSGVGGVSGADMGKGGESW